MVREKLWQQKTVGAKVHHVKHLGRSGVGERAAEGFFTHQSFHALPPTHEEKKREGRKRWHARTQPDLRRGRKLKRTVGERKHGFLLETSRRLIRQNTMRRVPANDGFGLSIQTRRWGKITGRLSIDTDR